MAEPKFSRDRASLPVALGRCDSHAHTVLGGLATVKELLSDAPVAEAELRASLAVILERIGRKPVKGLATRPRQGSQWTRRKLWLRLDKPARLCLNVAVPKVMGLLPSQ